MCLNTVALVFLIQCDHLLYEKFVDRRTRAYAEQLGHVELDGPALNLVAFVKISFMAVPLATLAALFGTYVNPPG